MNWVGRSAPLVIVAAAVSLAIGFGVLAARTPQLPEHSVSFRPVQVSDGGYVSSQTCRACHPSQYASWQASFHRTMTQVARPATVRADFNSVRVSDVAGNPMQLTRRGDEFWAQFDDPDAPAGQPQRITRQIVMTTGSHLQQVYWYRTERSRMIGQLPGLYLIGERRWIPRRAAFMHPPGERVSSETGRWNGVCIDCHATHGRWRFQRPIGPEQPLDTQIADTDVAEFGIACEACHGPLEEHARLNRSPLRRYGLYLTGRADDSTILPPSLDAKRSSQVCGQCHGVWRFYGDQDKVHANTEGFPYRPGGNLADTRFVLQPAADVASPSMKRVLESDPSVLADSFWPDGMIRVSGREYNGLIDSPCYRNASAARPAMTCFSCHSMHKAPDDPREVVEWADTHQVSRGMEGNAACLQCHPAFRENIPNHTKHRADSSGSDCYNCHMPYTTYGLLKALRSHQVSSPSVASSVETGRPNACNLCHLDKTLAWTSEHLTRWYSQRPATLNDDERGIAASLLWLLRGDAGQRALTAWSMGWPPAQRASGTDWTAPFLAGLMDDPYDAVRFIAFRSLSGLPEFRRVSYNFVAPQNERLAAVEQVMGAWNAARRDQRANGSELLFTANGSLDGAAIARLVALRNDRRVSLRE